MTNLSSLLVSCVINAASVHQIPSELIVSIINVEGGRPGLAMKNKNKTEDLGIMQINTGVWLSIVANAHFDGNQNAAYIKLRDDPCYNIQIGSWILRKSMEQSPDNIWHGVGRYHSATPEHNLRYRQKVRTAWRKLF